MTRVFKNTLTIDHCTYVYIVTAILTKLISLVFKPNCKYTYSLHICHTFLLLSISQTYYGKSVFISFILTTENLNVYKYVFS